jgi:hypothetical protein
MLCDSCLYGSNEDRGADRETMWLQSHAMHRKSTASALQCRPIRTPDFCASKPLCWKHTFYKPNIPRLGNGIS